jgi:hypothetical protein
MFNAKRLTCFCACVAVLFAAATRSAQADSTNGGSGPTLDDPPLIVDADWFATTATPPAFFWGSGAGVLNSEGPFTFNAATAVRLDVTDDFDQGDRFEVYDFGASIGLTSLVAIDDGGEVGPEAAFNSALWSSGSFLLSAGAHSITIAAVVNTSNVGRGYLRALTIPEPSSIVIGVLAMITLLMGARVRP